MRAIPDLRLRHFGAAALLACVAACGGGGGGGSGDGGGPPPPPPPPPGPTYEAYAGTETPADPDASPTAPTPGAPLTYQAVDFQGEALPAARAYYLARYGIGLPFIPSTDGMASLWTDWPTPGMARIPNDGEELPQPDDLLVWRPWVGSECGLAAGNAFGHVAVVVETRAANEIIVVDSNWMGPLSGGQHTVPLSACVLGWFRPSPGANEYPALESAERISSDDSVTGLSVQPLAGAEAPNSWNGMLSSDGRYLAYVYAYGTNYHAYILDRVTRERRRVAVTPGGGSPNAGSMATGISADGARVCFQSTASNLAPADFNGGNDVFYRDPFAPSNATALVSRTAAGTAGNANSYQASISPDGGFIVFVEAAFREVLTCGRESVRTSRRTPGRRQGRRRRRYEVRGPGWWVPASLVTGPAAGRKDVGWLHLPGGRSEREGGRIQNVVAAVAQGFPAPVPRGRGPADGAAASRNRRSPWTRGRRASPERPETLDYAGPSRRRE